MNHVHWAKNANIYEVNLRQYTPEGTFAAFEAQLPRLAAMGVDILWLMPVHPVGVKNRKGTLGSAYSVRDYTAVNPDFGTLANFKRLVDAAHALGLHVIIDWVANHTAWDHPWVEQHPDWYKKDAAGAIHPYAYDNGREIEHWTDVVGLDYTQPAVRQAMTEALAWWVRECGVDGFRCDVASLVPTPFWEQARAALDAIKPVFLLAESADPGLHRAAFDMTYAWDLHDAMKEVAAGRADARALAGWVDRPWPKDAYRMLFTTNHDKNAWEGHDAEIYGSTAAFKAFAVLAATLPGMPLVYGGQEAWLDKRLAFFEQDPIDWRDRPLAGFYAGLLRLKRDTQALWNGAAGGDAAVLDTGNDAVFAFTRAAAGGSTVTVAVNLSGAAQTLTPRPARGSLPPKLPPWGHAIETATTATTTTAAAAGEAIAGDARSETHNDVTKETPR